MTTTIETSPATSTPQLFQVAASGDWQGRLRTDIETRGFTFTVAEPEGLGGDDTGPNPLEYVLGGFQGCIAVVVEVVARERGITLTDLRTHVSGTIDLRGFGGVHGVSPSFLAVEGSVRVFADIDEPAFDALVAEVERRCPLYNLFRDAGVTPAIRWSLNV